MVSIVLGYARVQEALWLPVDVRVAGGRVVVAVASCDVTRPQFHRLVSDCCSRAAFLPARHGVRADDLLLAHCADKAGALVAAIAKLGGLVELSVDINLAARSAQDGRSYLALCRDDEEQLTELAARVVAITERLGGKCRMVRRARRLEAALLMQRSRLGDAVGAFRHFEASYHSEVTVQITGPWPPYRFAAALAPEFT